MIVVRMLELRVSAQKIDPVSEHVNGHLAVKFYGINFSACFCDLSLQCNF